MRAFSALKEWADEDTNLYLHDDRSPGSINTIADDINNKGDTVGYYFDSNGVEHGFLDSGGTYTTINFPDSGISTTLPLAINASGEITGYYYGNGITAHGFLYSHGTYTTINFPGSTSTLPDAINASGDITGYYYGNGITAHGFLYSHGTYTTIDPPGSSSTLPKAINASDQIVGFYAGGGAPHGFLASETSAPKVGLGSDTFVFAPNSGHDTNGLLDATQPPKVDLASLQHAATNSVTHDAHDAGMLPDVHTANLHANPFHLV